MTVRTPYRRGVARSARSRRVTFRSTTRVGDAPDRSRRASRSRACYQGIARAHEAVSRPPRTLGSGAHRLVRTPQRDAHRGPGERRVHGDDPAVDAQRLPSAETYHFRAGAPLRCPVSAFGGLLDDEVVHEEIEAWRRHTTGPFRARMFLGDHFFLELSRRSLLGPSVPTSKRGPARNRPAARGPRLRQRTLMTHEDRRRNGMLIFDSYGKGDHMLLLAGGESRS
jgi:hypothetical protein